MKSYSDNLSHVEVWYILFGILNSIIFRNHRHNTTKKQTWYPNDNYDYMIFELFSDMSPESYEKIWKKNFLLSGIHSLV